MSYIFNKKIEYILPLITASISLVLYSFAYFGVRSLGVTFVLMALMTSVIYAAYKKVHSRDRINQVFKSAGLIYFILMTIFAYIISRGFMFSAWDEFSHWGLVLKNIFLSNDFGNLASSTTYFKEYPQGISLFSGFITHFSKTFSEPNALFGILILSYSQLAIIFTKIKYTDWKKLSLISSILFVLPIAFFGSFYSTIYVDAIMGLIFGNILYFNYVYHKKDFFYAVYMGLQFYLLANTKQIGIGLVLIAFLAILIDFLRSNKLKPFKPFLLNKKNELIFMFIPLVVGILTNLSWTLYVKSHHISELFQISGIKLSDILNLFGGNAPAYRKATIVNFIMHFFTVSQRGAMFFSYFLISVILLLTMLYIYKKTQTNNQRSFALQSFSFIGLYIYAGAILFMYLFAFSEYEAQNLASIDRYLGTYLLGLLMLSLFILIDYFVKSQRDQNSQNLKLAFLLVSLLFIVPVPNLINDTLLSHTTNISKQQMRAPYEDIKQYMSILNAKTDRVYIISQDTEGFDYWVLRYDFTPIQVSPNFTWSLGAPYSSSDIWTVNKTAQEWSKDLENYTYVYLYSVDDRFINNYGQLFENVSAIKGKSMYSISKIDKRIILKNISTNM